MRVLDHLTRELKKGKLHMTLLDPEKIDPKRAEEIAKMADKAGSSAIMVGGSTGGLRELDRVIEGIKRGTDLPTILFPSGASLLSAKADAVYFMSLLNSRSIRYIVGEQLRGAPLIKKSGIEPIPIGYIIVEPGGKVGEVGEADLILRGDHERAANYALLAEYMGMKLVYLEAGSGAPEPIPTGMVEKVKETISLPLIVGGGIRTPESARNLAEAGADIIVTGTLVEGDDVEARLNGVVKAIRGR